MPRGVPKNGIRMTKGRIAAMKAGHAPTTPIAKSASDIGQLGQVFAEETHETDEQILARLDERFEVLEDMTAMAFTGDVKGLVVSGPPGVGKSFTIFDAIKQIDDSRVEVISGKVKTTGLFKLLYRHRKPGHVVVFDDSDTILTDEDSLNMLKKVIDTMKDRNVSYLADYDMVDEASGDVIPKTFKFEGSIIFITNLDFDALIGRGHRLAPHLEAIVSRSHYIDLAMKTRRDYMLRIKQVIGQGMLTEQGLTDIQTKEVVDFIEENQDNLRELSLRIAVKLGVLCRTQKNWKRTARVTCCRGIT